MVFEAILSLVAVADEPTWCPSTADGTGWIPPLGESGINL